MGTHHAPAFILSGATDAKSGGCRHAWRSGGRLCFRSRLQRVRKSGTRIPQKNKGGQRRQQKTDVKRQSRSRCARHRADRAECVAVHISSASPPLPTVAARTGRTRLVLPSKRNTRSGAHPRRMHTTHRTFAFRGGSPAADAQRETSLVLPHAARSGALSEALPPAHSAGFSLRTDSTRSHA